MKKCESTEVDTILGMSNILCYVIESTEVDTILGMSNILCYVIVHYPTQCHVISLPHERVMHA